MKVSRYTIFILLFPTVLFSQSVAKQFKKLSVPERHWALAHPFKAKKAFRITQKVRLVVDSIKQAGIIGADNNGGKLDAFKHTYWMASLSVGVGSRRSLKLGKAHEKGNYLQYKKHQLEENNLPDSVSSEMDLENNYCGAHLVDTYKDATAAVIQKKVLDALKEGKLAIIRKDIQGNFLTCVGQVISLKEWAGKWNIPKCIITSNQ